MRVKPSLIHSMPSRGSVMTTELLVRLATMASRRASASLARRLAVMSAASARARVRPMPRMNTMPAMSRVAPPPTTPMSRGMRRWIVRSKAGVEAIASVQERPPRLMTRLRWKSRPTWGCPVPAETRVLSASSSRVSGAKVAPSKTSTSSRFSAAVVRPAKSSSMMSGA